MNKETYVISNLEYDWQKAIRMTEEQAKAIEWFIKEADVNCIIERADEIREEIE